MARRSKPPDTTSGNDVPAHGNEDASLGFAAGPNPRNATAASAAGTEMESNAQSVDTDDFDPQNIHDELPDDLNAVEYVGPYQFPDNARRRTPAALYALVGLGLLSAWVATRSSDTALVNRGFAWGGLFLLALGVYGMAAGRRLNVSDVEALSAASAHIGFPIGHASAQLGWRGLLSRPTWRILLYSAEDPPKKRGLVLVDGCDASIVGDMIEENPEDWSQFDL